MGIKDDGVTYSDTKVDLNAIYTTAVGSLTVDSQFGLDFVIHPNNKHICVYNGKIIQYIFFLIIMKVDGVIYRV